MAEEVTRNIKSSLVKDENARFADNVEGDVVVDSKYSQNKYSQNKYSQNKHKDNFIKDDFTKGGLTFKNILKGGRNKDVDNSAKLFESHYESVWDSELKYGKHKDRLVDSFWGRSLVRVFSRGILAAAAMTYTDRLMNARFDPAATKEEISALGSLVGFENRSFSEKSLEVFDGYLLKGFHKLAGGYNFICKPIEMAFGKDAVTFHPRGDFSKKSLQETYDAYNSGIVNSVSVFKGISIGHEAVKFNLPFAFAAGFDALGREISKFLDPAVKKNYFEYDDKGEISGFKPKIFLKESAETLWDITTYRAMEDIVATIPYLYQIKWQREFLAPYKQNNKSEAAGKRLLLDTSFTAHGFKGTLNEKGKLSITGDYNSLAFADLQIRFMGYNWYTLMFRDVYNHIAQTIDDYKISYKKDEKIGFHLPNISAEGTLKYLLASAIKTTMFTVAPVAIFAGIRTPQGKYNSPIIVDNKYPVSLGKTKFDKDWIYNPDKILITDMRDFDKGILQESGKGKPLIKGWDIRKLGENAELYSGSRKITEGLENFDPTSFKHCKTNFSTILNFFGKATDSISEVVDKIIINPLLKDKSKYKSGSIAWDFTKNSIAYSPYMITKYEAENIINTPDMDASIYRMIDGFDHINFGEIKAGASDIWSAARLKPVSDETSSRRYDKRSPVNSFQRTRDKDAIATGKLDPNETYARKIKQAAKEKEAIKNNSVPANKITTNGHNIDISKIAVNAEQYKDLAANEARYDSRKYDNREHNDKNFHNIVPINKINTHKHQLSPSKYVGDVGSFREYAT